jgi:uncharacterized protein YajQ (UPF0234 family)
MPSFDVVSKIDMQEVTNAVVQTTKEIGQRYDFKGSKSTLTLTDGVLTVVADDDAKLQAILEILMTKMLRRGVSPQAMDRQKIESASGGLLRQNIQLVQGISSEKAKDINRFIKDLGAKVNSEIQKEQLRVSGKKRDDLQTVIAALKAKDFGIPLQFINFRD